MTTLVRTGLLARTGTLSLTGTKSRTGLLKSRGSPSFPAWFAPFAAAGATDGLDFTQDNGDGTFGQAWIASTLITDLTTQIGGVTFDDPTGMGVLSGNANRPILMDALLAKVCAVDWCAVYDVNSPIPVQPSITQREFLAISEGPWASADNYFDGALYVSDPDYIGGLNSSFEPGGPVPYPFTTAIGMGANKMAQQVDPLSGVILAANNTTAAIGTNPMTGVFDTAHLGFGASTLDPADSPVNLTFRTWIFYPNGKTAPQVQALTA